MGRFARFLGDTEIEIDGEKLKLKATVKDMQKIMDLGESKEKLIELGNTIIDIMKRSYPDEPIEEIEAFVSKNLLKFIPELAIAWKWTTRENINDAIEEAKKSISQIKR